MHIGTAGPLQLTPAVDCLVAAFAHDPITGYLLQTGPGYPGRVRQFFTLLMRARMALGMPVLLARSETGIHGAVMGYATSPPAWPTDIAQDWDQFEKDIPGLVERMARYDEIAQEFKPAVPHYYLGVIGVDPSMHGQSVGSGLLRSFCALSLADPASEGVYLETANPANVGFYQRHGFRETGRGRMGDATLWCMFLSQHEVPATQARAK